MSKLTLEEAIARLNDKHNHTLVFNPKQLAGLLTELKEAKRLLKAAVEDLEKIASVDECSFPYCDSRCPFECVGQCEEKHWKHKDEALKLIGEDGEQNG